MKNYLEFDSPVLSFSMENDNIYALKGKTIGKYPRKDLKEPLEVTMFEKEGLARGFIIDEKYLYCKDFCMFYIINKSDLSCIYKAKLGEDLTSDICGMTFDTKHVYVCLRDGSMVVINKVNYDTTLYKISNSSIWVIKSFKDLLYAGNVEGCLLIIDKSSMEVVKTIKSHKQNLKSLYVDDQRIITVSQDKQIIIRDYNTLEIINSVKNAHKKMFHIAAIWNQFLLTVSFPCGEMKYWELDTLNLIKTIDITRALSGDVEIEGSTIYLSSRKVNGILSFNIDIN